MVTLSATGNAGTITYTLAGNSTGGSSFTYTVSGTVTPAGNHCSRPSAQ